MKRVLLTPQLTGLALLAFAARTAAQEQPYPYQAPPSGQPAPAYGPPPPAQNASPSVNASASAQLGGPSQVDFGLASEGTTPEADEAPAADLTESERAFRKTSLGIRSGLGAATGLLRVTEAGAGAPGIFRASFIGSWVSSTGFLCNSGTTCPTLSTEAPSKKDEVERVGAHFVASATVLPFLEGYLGLHNSATSDNRSRPQLLQVLGDTNFGVKAFMPWEPDQLFTFGGQADLFLLNGTGGVGLDGGGTSFGLRGLATADLSNRSNVDDQVPLRFHANFGYLFDNSANLVEPIETEQPPVGRGTRITRIERYGLDVNRVDSIQVGLGTEFVHPVIRPFMEWSIDLPANRQNHVCNVTRAGQVGDKCLGREAGFATSPSRLGLGAGLYPWEDHGLEFTGAVEIATGGSSKFIEEVAPESPWNLYFGLGYAFDTQAPKPIIERVASSEEVAKPLPPAPRYVVNGQVVEKGTQTPVVDALIRYEGREITGMISDATGHFRSVDLEPGTYSFNVTATGYRDGKCSVTIQPGQAPIQGPGMAPANPNPFAPPAAPVNPQMFPQSGRPRLGNELGMPGLPFGQMQPGYGPQPQQPGYGPQPTAPVQPGYGPAPVQPGYGGAPVQPGYGPTEPGAPLAPGQTPPNPAAPPVNPNAPIVFDMQCELEALPKVGNVVGAVLDGESQAPVANARIKIQDKLGRELELSTDAQGSFRFENVIPGRAFVSVEAPGYMMGAQEFEVKAQNDVDARLSLNKRPAKPNVVVLTREIKLNKSVNFEHDSAEITPDSFALLEEIATVMNERPDVKLAEVQGHTDNSGASAYNLKLSQERAESVVNALVRLGVARGRLEAKGYGQEKPLVPNTTEPNMAKNRRVQIIIKQRG